MGQVDRTDLVKDLARQNPKAKFSELQMCADALKTYAEASANVRKNGAICSHPRTGAPIENPYLKIMTAMAATIKKNFRSINTDKTLEILLRTYENGLTVG